ncbi:1-acylglycerol-3-phosphate O-acyltransferase [Nocardia cyriacigeorgica]|uniref:1-acyl-sn-glycerol-3-phosphate acyltransferase n=1 Tax=Nocardia cyriacigeorgica TaxID=135487 RepID=A0A5R8P9J9_9NOCA|nr:1-acylglycerol-3-phosphate O-acyltransferase [Nocardia cyriacigeorgica]TLG03027.1 1-acylglycerol-3-phosphate O-acyltransferase [Nocardia cyriacigeorgica]
MGSEERYEALELDAAHSDIASVVEAIRVGPQGPAVAAVFELGGVVVDGFDAAPTQRRLFRRGDRDDQVTGWLLDGVRDHPDEGSFGRFLHTATRVLAGRTDTELDEIGTRLFRSTIYGHIHPEAWRLIRAHRAAGHTVVLVSSGPRFVLEPVAAALGVAHTLCTGMATEDGVLTGYPDGRTLWRSGKAEAIREFAAASGIELGNSFAYLASGTDLATLSAVGFPIAVNPDEGLAVTCAEKDWPALTFRARRPARPVDIARTIAGFAALIVGAITGVLVKSYTRDRRTMADALMKFGTGATLRATGVRLRVTGARNARSPRPAVFVFNHQSQYDVIIVPAVLGGGVTGIGKKELTKNPVFGPLMRFVGVTFIDRADTARAKASLEPVVHTLRDGLSIAVAPEGTRSFTPEVGPFKKGAFHIAIQAGVPVIPVVIRNAGEVSWRDSMVVRPGVVDVAVLDPIDVSGWDPANMHDEVERVRQLFVDTLLDWPE